MEPSGSGSGDHDEERKILETLIDVFSPTFSVKEIAVAFCQANRNPDLTAEILYASEGSISNGPVTHAPESGKEDARASLSGTLSLNPLLESIADVLKEEKSKETKPKERPLLIGTAASSSGIPSSNTLPESIADESTLEKEKSKGKKPKVRPLSIGTVSSVIGKDYAKRTTSATELPKTSKPLKLDMGELSIDEFTGEDVTPDSTGVGDHMHKDLEDFLFQMLGSGFQLDKDVIRDVLGFCGYDAEKSMEELMSMSASCLKNKDILSSSPEKVEEPEQKSEKEDLPQSQEDERYNLQKEVLTSLFSAPERVEEVPRRLHARAVKPPRPGRRVVFEPPDLERPENKGKQIQESEDEEDDTYDVLRRSTKEHWVTMKEYFKAAFEAFASGDRARADHLLKEGQHYHNKAREADEKSSQILLGSSTPKTDEGLMPVDLREYDMKRAIKTLKFFLSTLSGIPSQRLKIIIFDDNTRESRKISRKNKVLSLLADESLTWTEESDKSIIVELDGVDPENLSFYNENKSDGE